jgi:hypothetical protein
MNMFLLNVRLPGLLTRVECIAALMACIAMDKASLMYSLKLLCGYKQYLLNWHNDGYQIVLIFGINHIFVFFAVVYTSLM